MKSEMVNLRRMNDRYPNDPDFASMDTFYLIYLHLPGDILNRRNDHNSSTSEPEHGVN